MKLVECELPVDVISRDAAIEMSFKPRPAYIARCKELGIEYPKSFYDPKIRSLHPWLARRARSVARALNLSALLPSTTPAGRFLDYIGFNKGRMIKLVKKGYPPLVSYAPPNTASLRLGDETIMDPMAGGGSIPLESAILGMKTIACEYNPVAFLILRATTEFPAKYGMDLYERVREEAKNLINCASKELADFYERDVRGYIILRQVRHNNEITPLSSIVPITRKLLVEFTEGKVPKLVKGHSSLATDQKLLPLWMQQHVKVMVGFRKLHDVAHKCLVIQTTKGFRLADEKDQELLRKVFKEYLKRRKELFSTVVLPADNEVFKDLLPLKRYDFLFSPRQALALGLMISYVKQRIRQLIENEGEFGAAVGLYLAFGLDRLADFNSMITTWNSNRATIRDSIGSYYKFRKFRLEGIYGEAIVPFRTLEWVYEPDAELETAGGICPVLKELCEKLEGKNSKKVEIYMCNALELSNSFGEGKISVVNVDPPYYEKHFYSDFSEFFWFILRETLEDASDALFKNKILFPWSPSQWCVPRQEEIISRSLADKQFEIRLTKSLEEIKKVLKDDGLLLLWFGHNKFEAWKSTVKALHDAGFKVTNVIPLASEHPTRSITKGGVAGLNRVLILVARKSENAPEIKKEKVLKRFTEKAKMAKIYPREEIQEEELNILNSAASLALTDS